MYDLTAYRNSYVMMLLFVFFVEHNQLCRGDNYQGHPHNLLPPTWAPFGVGVRTSFFLCIRRRECT